jgi:hypothetical protein
MDADKDGTLNETPIDDEKAKFESRRKAMLKMAAYTAPVLLMTLTSEKAVAVSIVASPTPS